MILEKSKHTVGDPPSGGMNNWLWQRGKNAFTDGLVPIKQARHSSTRAHHVR